MLKSPASFPKSLPMWIGIFLIFFIIGLGVGKLTQPFIKVTSATCSN